MNDRMDRLVGYGMSIVAVCLAMMLLFGTI